MNTKFSVVELSDPAVNSIVAAGVVSNKVSPSENCIVKSPPTSFSIFIVTTYGPVVAVAKVNVLVYVCLLCAYNSIKII